MAHSPKTRNIETRLDREDLPRFEFGRAKPWRLMEIKPEAVSSPVEKAAPAPTLAIFFNADALGWIAVLGEKLSHLPMDRATIGAWAQRAQSQLLTQQANLPETCLCFRGFSPHHGSGEIPVIAASGRTGKEIENDQLMGL